MRPEVPQPHALMLAAVKAASSKSRRSAITSQHLVPPYELRNEPTPETAMRMDYLTSAHWNGYRWGLSTNSWTFSVALESR